MPNNAADHFATIAEAALPHDCYWAIESVRGHALWQMARRQSYAAHVREVAGERSAERLYFARFDGAAARTVDESEAEPEAGASAADNTAGKRVAGKPYAMAGSVAVINLTGVLTKRPTSMSGGTSTLFARRMVELAAADDDVNTIVLRVDSPGGSVAGTGDCADAVRAAASQKRVLVATEDLCASAAYWISSGATRIYCNPSGMVGSIGTYMTLVDMSRYAANEGLEVKVYRAGEMKGAGTPGTEITREHDIYFQKIVDDLNEHFLAGIAAGRKMDMDAVRALNNGRCFMAAEALNLGLIDGVATFAQVMAMAHAQDTDPDTDPDNDDGGDDDGDDLKLAALSGDTSVGSDAGQLHDNDSQGRASEDMPTFIEKARAWWNGEIAQSNASEDASAGVELMENAAKADIEAIETAKNAEIAERDRKLAEQAQEIARLSAASAAEAAQAAEAEKQRAADENASAIDALIGASKLTPGVQAQAAQLRASNPEAFDSLFAGMDPIAAIAGETAKPKAAKTDPTNKTVKGDAAARRLAAAGDSKPDAKVRDAKVVNNELAEAAATIQADNPGMSYVEALKRAAEENHDLIDA